MTQFTFGELKPRIEEAIRKRNDEKCYYDHVTNHRYLREGNGTRLGCCRTEDGKLYWDFEPIEISDGFTPHYFFRIYKDGAISRHEPYVEAIGKHTGQVYTWSLKVLLPELWEENND